MFILLIAGRGLHPRGKQLEKNGEQMNALLILAEFVHDFSGQDCCQLRDSVLDAGLHLAGVVKREVTQVYQTADF